MSSNSCMPKENRLIGKSQIFWQSSLLKFFQARSSKAKTRKFSTKKSLSLSNSIDLRCSRESHFWISSTLTVSSGLSTPRAKLMSDTSRMRTTGFFGKFLSGYLKISWSVLCDASSTALKNRKNTQEYSIIEKQSGVLSWNYRSRIFSKRR